MMVVVLIAAGVVGVVVTLNIIIGNII